MPLLSPHHPGFFEVLATRRAYTALLYMLLSLAIGVFTFTFTVTGLSLSLGLAILIIGIPIALAFLAGIRLLSVAETHLLKALVDDDVPPPPSPLPPGQGWGRLKSLLGDPRTWTSLFYFLLRLPLGVAQFSLMVSLLASGLALLAVPVAGLLEATGRFDLNMDSLTADPSIHPGLVMVVCGLAGLALIPIAFHLALLLGRFQAWLARHLLIRA